jgi:hypothetical protein
MMPQLHESRGEAKELLARWREARTGFIPNEKRSPELLLKEAYPCADRRLCDMGLSWDERTLFVYLRAPAKVVPGT